MSEPLYLSRLELNLRQPDAARELFDPVALHHRLMAAFPAGGGRADQQLLFRVDAAVRPFVLVQSRRAPVWESLPGGYLSDGGLHVRRMDAQLDALGCGTALRFRLLANPVRAAVTEERRRGRRTPLREREELLAWITRLAERAGFVPVGSLSTEVLQPVRGVRIKNGKRYPLTLHRVLFDGVLLISDPVQFSASVRTGLGFGKAYGFGLLSLAHGGE
ncbi:MAG: type I-E CRISPR-associated protein Cas6/Cse3/CasE [Gemmatimonadetes bacterium]|nr:type I-E CRISPR-associated protein Cas6/Cse3/CasE [Gemmatimonadota bacterium]